MDPENIRSIIFAEFNSRDRISKGAMFHEILMCISHSTLLSYAQHLGIDTAGLMSTPGLKEALLVEKALAAQNGAVQS